MKKTILLCAFFATICSLQAKEKPNIIYILADDLGYGDVQSLNPERSKVPTPHLDALASQGMTFLDAHSGSSVCTPTRYGVLTGRYAWRTRLQEKVIKYGEPLIAADRLTVAGLLRGHGYDTAGFGKWHLGLQYQLPSSDKVMEKEPKALPKGTRIVGGPVSRGFESYYWFKLFWKRKSNQGHWTMIEDDVVVEDIPLNALLPGILERALTYINEKSKADEPFFVYFGAPRKLGRTNKLKGVCLMK